MDRRLRFRHRARTAKSERATGLVGPSAALEMRRLTPQVAPCGLPREGRGPPRGGPSRSGLAPKKSPVREAARARTANRHWWPGASALRGTGEPSSRNSASWPRNFGRRGARWGEPALRWGALAGRREEAQATVYQKHSSLLTRKGTYRG